MMIGVNALFGSMAAFDQEAAPIIAVAIMSLAVGVLVGYLLTRGWRNSTKSAQPDAGADEGRRSQLYEKRQVILRRLQKDLDLLLENQVEVRNLMSTQVVRVLPGRSVMEMRRLMSTQHLRHLVVVDETERAVGVISDRDLLAVKDGVAADVMRTPVMAISPQSMLLPTVSHMIENNISCLPVVEDDHVVGIITTTDLLLTLQSVLRILQMERISRSEPSPTEEFAEACSN
ncbi:CBS domain-containing protein [Blastopirellula marina]|uniref:Putative acetoin utilization protein AcuB n=1 Tax=Blastopirellula marina DSM 3645 TaxID=314230 RepID=A3ZW89_9BACT|nr:CBS domain-containing protein [Blastopirellula marina]EAQ79117.1 putative acetoin utilization protein AcuB [Blastopirellula marina DSM 3645]